MLQVKQFDGQMWHHVHDMTCKLQPAFRWAK